MIDVDQLAANIVNNTKAVAIKTGVDTKDAHEGSLRQVGKYATDVVMFLQLVDQFCYGCTVFFIGFDECFWNPLELDRVGRKTLFYNSIGEF